MNEHHLIVRGSVKNWHLEQRWSGAVDDEGFWLGVLGTDEGLEGVIRTLARRPGSGEPESSVNIISRTMGG